VVKVVNLIKVVSGQIGKIAQSRHNNSTSLQRSTQFKKIFSFTLHESLPGVGK
jgi:hypothetical protein